MFPHTRLLPPAHGSSQLSQEPEPRQGWKCSLSAWPRLCCSEGTAREIAGVSSGIVQAGKALKVTEPKGGVESPKCHLFLGGFCLKFGCLRSLSPKCCVSGVVAGWILGDVLRSRPQELGQPGCCWWEMVPWSPSPGVLAGQPGLLQPCTSTSTFCV